MAEASHQDLLEEIDLLGLWVETGLKNMLAEADLQDSWTGKDPLDSLAKREYLDTLIGMSLPGTLTKTDFLEVDLQAMLVEAGPQDICGVTNPQGVMVGAGLMKRDEGLKRELTDHQIMRPEAGHQD